MAVVHRVVVVHTQEAVVHKEPGQGGNFEGKWQVEDMLEEQVGMLAEPVDKSLQVELRMVVVDILLRMVGLLVVGSRLIFIER